MLLVVGLGNPGANYLDTRHNVGFLVVDRLARLASTGIDREQSGALVAKAQVADAPAVLAKPQKYMNLSGGPTHALRTFYKVEIGDVIVVHDEMDLPFGDVRIKVGGGHGGHNGLRDLVQHVGAGFVRVRVGVGRPPDGWDPAAYVLGRWSADQAAALPDLVDRAADAVASIVRVGIEKAMQASNTRGGRPPARGGGSPPTPGGSTGGGASATHRRSAASAC